MHLILAAALLLAPAWRIIGPGGGGAQFHPTLSPHTDEVVLVACDMTGSYVSTDGGDTWRMFNLRGVSRFFAYDPADPKVLYAGANALWRSGDLGKTWQMLYPDPRTVTGSNMGNDHADESLLIGDKPAPRPRALAVHPTDAKRLYLAVEKSLLTSGDGGKTWSVLRELDAGTRKLYVSKAGTVYVIGDAAVHKLEGTTWLKGGELGGIQDISAGWAADGRFVVYAVANSAVQVSDDGGLTWRALALPGKGARPRAIATSLNHADTAYVSYGGMDGGAFGVAKTADRGASWQLVWRETNTAPATNIRFGWIEQRFGSQWAGHPLSLGVSPTNPNVAYGTDFGRTMRTVDGGAKWEAVYTKAVGEGWDTTGLDVTTAYGVHFDPFDAKRIFISYTDIGAFRSEDGGRSWISATQGISRRWSNTTYWLEFDPKVRGRVWGVFSGTHDLPRPKMWRRTSPDTFRGGVGISEDGGRSWQMVTNGGMPETAATHIVLDPTSSEQSRTLYVAAFGRGVYKSTDGGKTWVLKNEGLPATQPFAWQLARDGSGRLYLVIARRSEDGASGNAGDGSLFYSDDGAEHWRPLKLPAGVNGPNGLAIDPKNSKRLYLAAWARRGTERKAGGGIFRSDDAGETWKPIFEDDQHVYDVTIDPRNPKILYACGFESSAWRSADSGATWQKIRGYDFKWGHRVVPDPRDADAIYITTFGGSVWHGPTK